MPLRFSTFGCALPAVLIAASSAAQNTVPHWSGFLGSASRDAAVAVALDPSGAVIVAGHTSGSGLATPVACQMFGGGGPTDAFVACIDPRRPCGSEVVWCICFGGTGMELVFDLHVDGNGIVTIVGLSNSLTLPGQGPPTNNGATDGFVAQFFPGVPGGAILLSSMFFGGAADDRICDVEVDSAGVVTVAGVTEQPNSLPNAANSYHGGLTDAFVAQLLPQQPPGSQVAWSYYLGGNDSEGLDFPSWPGLGISGECNLDRMGLDLDPAGNPVVVTASVAFTSFPPTTGNACQPTHADANSVGGFSDAYLAVLNPNMPPSLSYATFYGGTGSDRPQSVVCHPGGGYVIGGYTYSMTLPVTPGCLQPVKQQATAPFTGINVDGFVCHIDPTAAGPAGLLYGTYLGGNAGEDAVYAMAVETSGRVTVAGTAAGGTFPLTARCLQGTNVTGAFSAMVARLDMAGNGARDLLYSTLVGGAQPILGSPPGPTNFKGLALDLVGDVYVTGYSQDPNYPTMPCMGGNLGGRDAVLTHMPLSPGCVSRSCLPCATAACTAPLYIGMGGAPVPGTIVDIIATNAPPSSFGAVVLGSALPCMPCPPISNASILVSAASVTVMLSDASGSARYSIPVPAGLPPPTCPVGISAQWLFLTNGACPGTGLLASSERLDF